MTRAGAVAGGRELQGHPNDGRDDRDLPLLHVRTPRAGPAAGDERVRARGPGGLIGDPLCDGDRARAWRGAGHGRWAVAYMAQANPLIQPKRTNWYEAVEH